MHIVEVIQDGAAVFDRSTALGIYTKSIATCVAYLFFGRDGVALIHDTGQLAVPSMVEVVRRCGPVRESFSVYNPKLESKKQAESHRERQARIRGALNLKAAPTKVATITGDIYFKADGAYGTDLSEVAELLSSLPDRERRLCVNEINNLFAPRNAQSLPVDIQFSDGAYRPLPRLLWRVEAMLLRANVEYGKGDGDYLRYLHKAAHAGVFSTPPRHDEARSGSAASAG